MENTYDLKQIIDLLRKRVRLILTTMFIGLAAAGVATFFVITPKYSSQAQLVVTLPKTEGSNVNDVNTNLQMINTYKDFIVSDSVLTKVQNRLSKEAKLDLTVTQIKDTVTVQQNQNSQMFSIIVTSEKASEAATIANTVAKVFQESAKDVLNVDRITIISSAIVNGKPVSPNNRLNLAIGIVIGIMIGVGITFLMELLNRTVKEPRYVTEELGFTLLGTVPEISDKERTTTIKKVSAMARMGQTSSTKGTNVAEEQPRRRRSRV